MAEAGAAIIANRAPTVARLAAAQDGAETAFPRADLTLTGPEPLPDDRRRPCAGAGRRPPARHGGRAHAGRPAPRRPGRRYAAKGVPADQCSTGEQKALLITLILANARALAPDLGAPPILLLDEVAAHLDATRRAALYDEIWRAGRAGPDDRHRGGAVRQPWHRAPSVLEVTETDGQSPRRRRLPHDDYPRRPAALLRCAGDPVPDPGPGLGGADRARPVGRVRAAWPLAVGVASAIWSGRWPRSSGSAGSLSVYGDFLAGAALGRGGDLPADGRAADPQAGRPITAATAA